MGAAVGALRTGCLGHGGSGSLPWDWGTLFNVSVISFTILALKEGWPVRAFM